MTVDPFVLLAPVLLLAVIALFRFVGCFIKPDQPSVPVDFTFGSLSPPVTPTAAGAPLDGAYKNGPPNSLDFLTGQWLLGLGTGMESLHNIFFVPAGTSGSFKFADGTARTVTSLGVFTTIDGMMTLSGDNPQDTPNVTLPVNAADPPKTLLTGWTSPTKMVTVAFTAGDKLGIDTITYLGPP